MSRENVETVRTVFEAFQAGLARGDPAAAFDLDGLADDAEWIAAAEVPEPVSYRGRDGFAEFMRLWTEDFERWSIEVEQLIDAGGDRVVGLFRQWATGKGSGVPVELRSAIVYELEEGRVVRMRNYVDHSEALEAAGLSE
jgi:ketosteroid isomerase-like protein